MKTDRHGDEKAG